MEKVSAKFRTRLFVAQVLTFCIPGLLITGIINHIYGLTPINPTRHAWMAAHNVFGFLFIVFSVLHIALNYRAFCTHLKNTFKGGSIVGRELLLTGLVMALAVLFVFHGFFLGE